MPIYNHTECKPLLNGNMKIRMTPMRYVPFNEALKNAKLGIHHQFDGTPWLIAGTKIDQNVLSRRLAAALVGQSYYELSKALEPVCGMPGRHPRRFHEALNHAGRIVRETNGVWKLVSYKTHCSLRLPAEHHLAAALLNVEVDDLVTALTSRPAAPGAPTKAQLKDPAWWDQHAPEDAEAVHVTGQGYHFLQKANVPGGEAIRFWSDLTRQWMLHQTEDAGRSRWEEAYFRPELQTDEDAWVDGLPPVGVECEYQPDPAHKDIWHKCTFLAHMDGEFFVLRSEDSSVDRMNDSFPASRRFRPLKTETERQREEVIGAAAKVAGEVVGHEHGLTPVTNIVCALYDAGMLHRKKEPNDA